MVVVLLELIGDNVTRTLRKVAGIWTGEEGYKYVRKIRKEWEKRSRRIRV